MAIRIPSNDEQRDFDELILALTKVLVDSLNEKQLNAFISEAERESTKGSISRLEKALIALGVQGFEDHIKFLRNLQNLRSAGAAHRKGSNYKKIAEEFGVTDKSLREVFGGILHNAIAYLNFLDLLVKEGSVLMQSYSGGSGGKS